MNFTATDVMEGALHIKSEEKEFLAIDSGLKNRSFVGVDTSRLQSLPGLIVKEGEIHNWILEGVTEWEGKTLFYGPNLQGKTLASMEINPQILQKLCLALYAIKERNFPVRQFSLSSVFFCDDGSVLFFPPRLMEFLNSHRLRENSLEMIEPWNSPKLGGESGRAFTLASLSYKLITGKVPFPGKDEEEIEKLISNENYASPLLEEPLLKEEMLSGIGDSFSGKATLSQWREILTLWVNEGIVKTNVGDEERDSILENEKKRESRRLRFMRSGAFFTKHKSKIVAGLSVLVVLILILQAPISKYLEPPVTVGMSQREVINLYYSSYSTLDTEILEDTITSDAGKGDINEISTIYVTSKVRSSYEGTTGLLTPDEWIADGSKALDPGINVFGISDLKIRPIGPDTFEATYTKWNPQSNEDINDTTPITPIGEKHRDRLHLSIKKDAWIIDKVDRYKE